MTVVMDLETGIVLHVGKGKGSDALTGFWKRIKRNKVKIEAVAIDMSPAFISALVINLPDVQIVFDHFHIVKMLNDSITKLRQELYRQEKELNKKEKLQEILEVNEPLSIAYYLKEELKLLWQQESKELAQKFLGKWVAKAMASGVLRLQKFVNTLLAHRSEIFAWV